MLRRCTGPEVIPCRQKNHTKEAAMAVKPVPEGYHSVTPYLIVRGAVQAIECYKKAFGASELMRFPGPDGKIAHAEIRIGDSTVMLADEGAEHKSPQTAGESSVGLLVYVPDV